MRLGLIVIVAMLALPAASAAEEMLLPPIAVGDEWDFFVAGEAQGPSGAPEKFAYVGKRVVAARESVNGEDAFRIVELNAGVRTSDEPESWIGKSLAFDGLGIEWMRASDGHTLKRARYQPDGKGGFVNADVTEHPGGCDTYGYPFSVGRNYSWPCKESRNGGPPADFTPLAKVTARESVTVPAGTFDAFAVDMGANGGTFERQWYAPESCWRVKSEGLAGNPIHMVMLAWRCPAGSSGALITVQSPGNLATIGTAPENGSRGTPAPALAALAAFAIVALLARRAE